MSDVIFNTGKIHLKANQIACLEYRKVRLYGEVIQIIPRRQICWFRPIYLIDSRLNQASLSNDFIVDLRAGSDLLWPEILFRPALDTEVLDFLAQLNEIDHTAHRRLSSQKYLNNFLYEVWQSHQDKF
ncbi:MAG: hypothetical protein AAGE84_22830 [Cyanobacteria bacterium P01_G01_bin.39]